MPFLLLSLEPFLTQVLIVVDDTAFRSIFSPGCGPCCWTGQQFVVPWVLAGRGSSSSRFEYNRGKCLRQLSVRTVKSSFSGVAQDWH